MVLLFAGMAFVVMVLDSMVSADWMIVGMVVVALVVVAIGDLNLVFVTL